MALWWTSSLSLTLDTVSVLVTQYNNTAVIRTTTIYEDSKSVNITTMKEAQSMAFGVLTAINPEYLANGFILNNGTNAFVDGTFSVAYPTPFIGIQGFEFISVTQQASQCPKGLQYAGQNLGTAECACLMQTYMDDPRRLGNAITSQMTLSSTYYELGSPHPVNNDLGTILEGPIPIKNASYSSFIESVLGSEGFNKYRSCEYLDVGGGPPALMMPVTALTATTTATVKSAGNYGTPSPKPGSPIAPIIHTPTSTSAAPPSVPIVDPKPVKEPLPASSTAPYVAPQTVAPVGEQPVPIVNKPLSSKSPANSPVNAPAKAGCQGTVEKPPESSGTSQPGSSGGQHAIGPSHSGSNGQSNTGAQSDAGSDSNNSNGKGSDTGDNQAVPAPVVGISYAGSSITPETSSHYNIPKIGKLNPGGSPVTINNVVFSLAPSATALVSNGQTTSIPTFVAAVPGIMRQIAAPALKFAGSAYTADSSSNISCRTDYKSGRASRYRFQHAISLAHGASIVDGTTQSLFHSSPGNDIRRSDLHSQLRFRHCSSRPNPHPRLSSHHNIKHPYLTSVRSQHGTHRRSDTILVSTYIRRLHLHSQCSFRLHYPRPNSVPGRCHHRSEHAHFPCYSRLLCRRGGLNAISCTTCSGAHYWITNFYVQWLDVYRSRWFGVCNRRPDAH